MCVLTESVPVALDDSYLLDLVLSQAPGTIARLDSGANLLFANCGRAGALIALSRRFPRSLFLGLEASRGDLTIAHGTARTAGVQNLWLEPGPAHLPRLSGIFDFALHLPAPAGTSLTETVSLLRLDGLLFDLHPSTPTAASYHEAGLEVIRRSILPDGLCFIARK